MQVAVVTPRYPPISSGGGEQSARLLATQLAGSQRIDSVTVFSLDGKETTHLDGVNVKRLGAVSPAVTEIQNFVAGLKLRGCLSRFDIVHAYNMELHPVVGYLANEAGVPSVGTLNSYHFFSSSVTNTTASGFERVYELIGLPTTGRVLRRYMKRIDAFIALSRAIERIYLTHGFGSARIEHIPNMIDPSFEVPNEMASSDSGSRLLLYVGALSEKKGVRYLVEAMALLPETYQLRIVGDGERASELRELSADLGVTDQVDFTGRIPYDEIGKVYAEADLFVHPGIWPEPLNRTVFEAMQAGLPIVCTDIGGPPEAIPDADVLVQPGDASALAEGIKYALDRGDEVGARNRSHVIDNYTPGVVTPCIIDFYKELIR